MRSVQAAHEVSATCRLAMRLGAIACLFVAFDAIAAKGDVQQGFGAGDAVMVAAADIPRPQFEVSTSNLPRFDNTDNTTQTSRVDMRLMPAGRSGFGLSLGMNNANTPGAGGVTPFAAPKSVDLGVHWRYTFDSNYRFDVTAYRRAPDADAMSLIERSDPTYGARVEMGLGSTTISKGFVADRGFVGLQLEGGARVTVKRKFGGPMFYWRNNF